MSLMDSNNNGMVMPVSPMYGGGNAGFGGYGGYGDGLFWIIILFLFAAMSGGWGNGFGNGNGGAILPFMMNQNTNNDVQRVVDQQSVMNGISALSAAQSNGFANAEISRCNGLYNVTSQLNNIAMTQQNCCCENRAAVADLKYTMAQEAALTRSNCDANKQAIMDKLCQLELDTVKQNYENKIATITANYENRISGMANTIDSLRTANSDARFDASQNFQTATIQAGQRTLANEIEQYVLPTAKPCYVVQNPNCCGQTFGRTCGVA